jgi:hypothetical protein
MAGKVAAAGQPIAEVNDPAAAGVFHDRRGMDRKNALLALESIASNPPDAGLAHPIRRGLKL